jgi:hypothetical protein
VVSFAEKKKYAVNAFFQITDFKFKIRAPPIRGPGVKLRLTRVKFDD